VLPQEVDVARRGGRRRRREGAAGPAADDPPTVREGVGVGGGVGEEGAQPPQLGVALGEDSAEGGVAPLAPDDERLARQLDRVVRRRRRRRRRGRGGGGRRRGFRGGGGGRRGWRGGEADVVEVADFAESIRGTLARTLYERIILPLPGQSLPTDTTRQPAPPRVDGWRSLRRDDIRASPPTPDGGGDDARPL